MHIYIIGNQELIGPIAMFAVMDDRHALALGCHRLYDRNNHRCLLLAVPASEPQCFLSHAYFSLLVDFMCPVLLSEQPETLAINL